MKLRPRVTKICSDYVHVIFLSKIYVASAFIVRNMHQLENVSFGLDLADEWTPLRSFYWAVESLCTSIHSTVILKVQVKYKSWY